MGLRVNSTLWDKHFLTGLRLFPIVIQPPKILSQTADSNSMQSKLMRKKRIHKVDTMPITPVYFSTNLESKQKTLSTEPKWQLPKRRPEGCSEL